MMVPPVDDFMVSPGGSQRQSAAGPNLCALKPIVSVKYNFPILSTNFEIISVKETKRNRSTSIRRNGHNDIAVAHDRTGQRQRLSNFIPARQGDVGMAFIAMGGLVPRHSHTFYLNALKRVKTDRTDKTLKNRICIDYIGIRE
jgi:hypothetical protein